MKSLNKNIVIVIAIVVVALAIVSFKTFVLGAGNTDAAKATMEKIKDTPDTGSTIKGTQAMPSSDGLHMPGNKH
jgi:hypothetical protein